MGSPGPCSMLVDTSAYLHTRWAASRIASALWHRTPPARFIVVLGDPVDRAVRHWRSINAALARPTISSGLRGGNERAQMIAYTNATSLSRKVRAEATQIGECLRSRKAAGGDGRDGRSRSRSGSETFATEESRERERRVTPRVSRQTNEWAPVRWCVVVARRSHAVTCGQGCDYGEVK